MSLFTERALENDMHRVSRLNSLRGKRGYEVAIEFDDNALAVGMVRGPAVPVLIGNYPISILATCRRDDFRNDVAHFEMRHIYVQKQGLTEAFDVIVRHIPLTIRSTTNGIVAGNLEIPFAFDSRLLESYLPAEPSLDGVISIDDLLGSYDVIELSNGNLRCRPKQRERGVVVPAPLIPRLRHFVSFVVGAVLGAIAGRSKD